MRRVQLFLIIAVSTYVTLFGANCDSALQILERRKDAKTHVMAKNASSSPLVAYVLTGGEKSADRSRTKVYSAVYSGSDSLAPGESIEIDVQQDAASPLNVIVDYVRLADGWSCGNAVTEEAKKIAARFQR